MKKLMILLALAAALTLSLTACGGNEPETQEEPPLSVQEKEPAAQDAQETEDPAEDQEDPAEEEKTEDPKEETKPAEKPQSKPQQKPAQTPSKPAETPSKPAETPSRPAETPSKPAPSATVGQTLKGVFQANASGSALDAANRVVSHESIPFSGMAMAVEPGLLMGFGNTEITGFSEGAMFGPSIGTIPFVGYVFTLDGSVDGSAFCQTLQSAADLRWNVCTEADELVVTQSGSKVFFLMCPTSFEG